MNSEDRAYLVKYRFAKAKKTFNEVELHIQNELWATAANRLYYACFYAVTSLLLSREINSKTSRSHIKTRNSITAFFTFLRLM